MSESNSKTADNKQTPLTTVFVVSQHEDYTKMIKGKKTYSAATRALMDYVRENLPPFGTPQNQEARQAKYITWLNSLTPDDLIMIGTEGKKVMTPVMRMWCALWDDYKLRIDELVVEDD